jgi:hypothetical protein
VGLAEIAGADALTAAVRLYEMRHPGTNNPGFLLSAPIVSAAVNAALDQFFKFGAVGHGSTSH